MRATPIVTLSFILPVLFTPFGVLAAQKLGEGNPIDAVSRDNSSVASLTLNMTLENSGVLSHSFISSSGKSPTPLTVPTSNQTFSEVWRSPSRTIYPSSPPFVTGAIAQNPALPVQNGSLPTVGTVQNQLQPPCNCTATS